MLKKSFSVKDKVKTEIKESVEKPVEKPVAKPIEKPITKSMAFEGDDRIPCEWEITSLGNGEIEALNISTRHSYKGSQKAFNEKMRG